MIRSLFDWLFRALDASVQTALFASFVWGLLGILLSPCHLSSIPLIVGYIDGQGRVRTRRAFHLSLLFSAGVLTTIAVIGLATGLMGRILGDIGKAGNAAVAVVFLLVGLYLLEIIPLPFLGGGRKPVVHRKGAWGALFVGMLFGIAVGPCTFAYMAPMLAVVFRTASVNLAFASSLILSYAIGHCSIIILAGTFTGALQKYLNWSEKSKGAVRLKKICGILVILAGIIMLVRL
jgi:cytochrome c-type biogenesis protein